MVETHIFVVFGLILSIIGIISGLAVKFYFAARKENSTENFDKGKVDTQIEHFKEKFNDLNKKLGALDEDIQQSRMEHDSIQKQFADIRDRVGTLEGIVRGFVK